MKKEDEVVRPFYLEPLFAAKVLRCSPAGKLSGVITGNICVPSTWKKTPKFDAYLAKIRPDALYAECGMCGEEAVSSAASPVKGEWLVLCYRCGAFGFGDDEREAQEKFKSKAEHSPDELTRVSREAEEVE